MSQLRSRRKGLFFAACVLTIAGCSSPRDPFSVRYERAAEQCFSAADFAQIQQELLENNAVFVNNHPSQYVVRKGDTLWGIAGRFLHKPWYWRQIWYSNPQIKNPNLIYPGDVLTVVTINGQKYLSITEAHNAYHGNATGRRTKEGLPVVRYEPGMTDPTLPGAASVLSHSVLAPFLVKDRIVSVVDLPKLPFIFGSGEQYLTLSQQNTIYTQGVQADPGTILWVYRPGEAVIDHDVLREDGQSGNELIGQQMNYIGEVAVQKYDPVSGITSLQPMEVAQALQEGDVLMLPDEFGAPIDYFPKLPSKQCQQGYILNSLKKQSLSITEFDTVVTSFGRDDGAQIGDVWAIQRPGQVRVIQGNPIAVPGETIGFLMLYKIYDRVSFGVVLDSTRPILETDYLVRP